MRRNVSLVRDGISENSSPASRLRALIEAPDILLMPGVYDGFSVRLVESVGFKAAFISGSGVSESRYGRPDVGLMGMSESVDAARVLMSRTTMSLLADIDTGYGNAVSAYFATEAFEAAGVAGIMIEDQVWPKRCGHMAGKELIGAEEMAMKVRSACTARRDPEFIVGARTDAIATDGIDEAIRRAKLNVEAGADLLFADALMSETDIGTFVEQVQAPVLVNMGFGIRRRATTPLLPGAQLQRLGVAAVIYPRLLTSAAIAGMRSAMKALDESIQSGQATDRPDLCVSFDELNELMGLSEIAELESRFLTDEERARKYGTGDGKVTTP